MNQFINSEHKDAFSVLIPYTKKDNYFVKYLTGLVIYSFFSFRRRIKMTGVEETLIIHPYLKIKHVC